MFYLGVINREFIVSGYVFSPLLERYQYKCNNYWDLVKHIPINELGHHWKWGWLGTCLVSSFYLNPQWIIANWNIKNKYLLNTKHKKKIFHLKKCMQKWFCKSLPFCPVCKGLTIEKNPAQTIHENISPWPILAFCQAWTNNDLLSIRPLRRSCWIKLQQFSFRKMKFKVSYANW